MSHMEQGRQSESAMDEVFLVDVLLLCSECRQPIKARINTPQWIRVEFIGAEGECQKCWQLKRRIEMVTAISDVRQTQTHAAETSKVIPLKIGIFSPQGGGKTTTAALIALALSVQYHDRAPVYVTDTEPGWQFLKRLFKIEGVELIQRTTPTFKAMMANMHEAERIGACVYSVDSLSIIWNELMQSFKTKNNGFIPINKWGDIRQMWNDYVTLFLNSSFHALALGRLGNITEEISLNEDNPAETKLMKTGTQFKAGGGESFGYEPHLLLELS